MINHVKGDLITLAKEGNFDIIAHGCNCFCRQKSGLAPQMVRAFHTNNSDLYSLEDLSFAGNTDKLGTVQGNQWFEPDGTNFTVLNAYTQIKWKTPDNPRPLSYEALESCMAQIFNLAVLRYGYSGIESRIGLPWIGCGLAGGDKKRVEFIIKRYLENFPVTIITYERTI